MSWPASPTIDDMTYAVVLDDGTTVHGRRDVDCWYVLADSPLTQAQHDEADRRLEAADDAERAAWLEDQAELNAAYRRGW